MRLTVARPSRRFDRPRLPRRRHDHAGLRPAGPPRRARDRAGEHARRLRAALAIGVDTLELEPRDDRRRRARRPPRSDAQPRHRASAGRELRARGEADPRDDARRSEDLRRGPYAGGGRTTPGASRTRSCATAPASRRSRRCSRASPRSRPGTWRFNIETKISPSRPDLSPSPEGFAAAIADLVRAHGLVERRERSELRLAHPRRPGEDRSRDRTRLPHRAGALRHAPGRPAGRLALARGAGCRRGRGRRAGASPPMPDASPGPRTSGPRRGGDGDRAGGRTER